MSKLTVFALLICTALLFTAAAPASALSVHDGSNARLECGDRTVAPAGDAAKIAFIKSLGFDKEKQPAKSPRRPVTGKVSRTECTGDGTMTNCCGSCGCCTWYGDGNGPVCKSWC
jgi:hypothetical protein